MAANFSREPFIYLTSSSVPHDDFIVWQLMNATVKQGLNCFLVQDLFSENVVIECFIAKD